MEGINPSPIPICKCVPIVPPASIAAFSGSTAHISISGYCAFSTSPIPVIVPPVPIPEQKPCIGPATCSNISKPVWCLCAMGFAEFSNCCGTYTFLSSAAILSAVLRHSSMHSPIFPASCISITSAP